MANETVLFKRGDSDTITSIPVTDGQILFDTSGNGKMYLDNGTDRLEMGGAITIDASLSKTSTNAIQNKAVTGNILNSLAEVSAATQQNTIAGALALKEVNSSLANGKISFGIDSNGNYGYKKEGADTVIPFSSGTFNGANLVVSGSVKGHIPKVEIASQGIYFYGFDYDDSTKVFTVKYDGNYSYRITSSTSGVTNLFVNNESKDYVSSGRINKYNTIQLSKGDTCYFTASVVGEVASGLLTRIS